MTVNAPKLTSQTASSPALAAWLPALLSIAAICAVFGIVFQREIVGAVRVWNDSTAYNHCFLVLPLAAVLVWMRRDIVVCLRPTPSWWPLAIIPGLSIVWFLAALLDVLEAAQLVAIALFETLLVGIFGWRFFRALMAPLLFLFFLVPFGAFAVPLLQRFTAEFTVRGLELFGIPVFADQLIIQIPEGFFEVAEACAGLRFLIASIVFGCFFATVVYRSPMRRLVFIGLSVLFPVIANGLRTLGLVTLAHFNGSESAALADHVLYGWAFFALVTLFLIAIGMSFAERSDRSLPGPVKMTAPISRVRVSTTAVAGLLLALIGPAYLALLAGAFGVSPGRTPLGTPRDRAWVLQPAPEGDWQPSAPAAEGVSIATYQNQQASVTQFVAHYPLPTRGSPLLRTSSSITHPAPWRLVNTGRVPVSFDGRTLEINTATIVHNDRERVVWWFYVVDGEATGSILQAKFLQLGAAIRTGSHEGAVVAVSTGADKGAVLTDFLQTTMAAEVTPIAWPGIAQN